MHAINLRKTAVIFAIVFAVISIFSLVSTDTVSAFGNSESGGCCGNDGERGDDPKPTPPDRNDNDRPVVPVCTITASPTSINQNGSSVLTWTSNRATSATINQAIGSVAVNGNRTVSPTATITYTMTVQSSTGDTASCAATVTVVPPTVPAPVCDSFTASPVTLPVGGGSVNLVWNTTNATTVTLDGQTVAVDGSQSVNVTANKTFTLNLSNTSGQRSCTASVTVATPTPAPVCDSFTASPATITTGGNTTLTWNTTNVTSVSINNGVGSNLAADGTASVSPSNSTTYTLTGTGANNQQVTCTVPVTVNPPTPNAPICDSFTASPATINRGQSTQLTWNTTNVTSASINNAVGSVNVDGTVSVSPLQNTTYTFTGVGTNNQQVTCTVPVTVIQPDAAITCAANVNFSASPTSIRRGDSSTLTWSTNGLTSVSFDNLNSTGLSGSVTVNPNDSTTYTLIGKKGSETINCPVTVNVSTSGGGGGGGGSSAPKCTLKISDNKISLGERVTITWDTTRATEVTLKDNHGKTLIDTDDKSSSEKKELYDGEITLRPEKDTTYTLVAEKGSRDKTCKVSVDVQDNIVVTQVRDQQPLVTGIALTNVPYTGFEAGPFMTSVFYTLLAAWALYMAYVLVGRRNAAKASAFTPATVTADVTPQTIMFPEKVTAAPVFHQTPVATVVPQTATIGYEAHTEITSTLEAQAHAAKVLISSDALAYFMAATAHEDRATILNGVLAAAKASYPSEDGWVTITTDRMVELAKSN